MSALFFLAVLIVVWSKAWSSDCTATKLTECTNLVSIHGQPPAVVPWYSKAIVMDICSRYQQFAQCLQGVLPSCNMETKLIYQGLRDAHDFFCNDGLEDYLQYQPCFNNAGLQTEAAHCNETLSNKLQYLKTYNSSYRRARLCQYSDDYVDCVGNVVKSFCSIAAESWQRKFDMRSLCPALVSYDCLGWATQCRESGSPFTSNTAKADDTPMWFVIVLSLSIALASLVIVTAVVILVCFRFCPARCRHRSSQHQQQQPASRRSSLCVELPPPYPGPFIPGQLASGVASPTGAGTTSAWLGHADDAGGEDEACGGVDVDVDKKFPSDDNDEGHFVPDAVEMSAKLAEVIPPPPHLNYDQHHYQRHHERHRHPRPHRHHAQQPQLHGEDCVSFVPDDDARDRSTARRYHGESTGSSGTPGSADWWRKMSTGSSGSSAATSLNASASASSSSTTGGDGGRLSGSSSSRRCSPPSFYVPSTRSSSQSSQSHLVLTDDPDTTQTDIDYY